MLVNSDSGKCLNLNRIDGFSTDVLENEINSFTGVLTIFLGEEVEKITIKCCHVFEALVGKMNQQKHKR